MAKDKNLLAHGIEEHRADRMIQSNGEEIACEISKKLSNLSFDIYEGENYAEEKMNYHGSFGNFYAKK